MRLAERLLGLTLVGANWVFWLLIALSVVSVAVMVERGIRLAGRQIDIDAFGKELLDRLSRGDVSGTRKFLADQKVPEADVVASGIDQFERGAAAVSAAMAGAKSKQRIELERNLGVLGTLGNNAPFIGLFGTVLGIIRSFADLSHAQNAGISVVIGGIAEALVAAAGTEQTKSTLALTLTKENVLYLNGEKTDDAAVVKFIGTTLPGQPDLQAIIAADRSVPHGDVVHIIDLVKRAGVHRFAINVDPAAGAATSK